MPNVTRTEAIQLQPGEVLTVTADAVSSGTLRRRSDSHGVQLSGANSQPIVASGKRVVGPFGTVRRYTIEVSAGSLTYTIGAKDLTFSTFRGNVEGFTGNRTLVADDNGKILRCDDASPVTITVPNDLPDGFNVGASMWGAGTVTVAAASGATKRSTTTALNTQYGVGSIIVMKNVDNASAEFVLGGDFA